MLIRVPALPGEADVFINADNITNMSRKLITWREGDPYMSLRIYYKGGNHYQEVKGAMGDRVVKALETIVGIKTFQEPDEALPPEPSVLPGIKTEAAEVLVYDAPFPPPVRRYNPPGKDYPAKKQKRTSED